MKNSITVQNLKCGGCAQTITSNLYKLENISEVDVNIEASTITFEAVNAEDRLKVKEKLRSLGYPSMDDANSLSSKAKSFVSCATGKMSS